MVDWATPSRIGLLGQHEPVREDVGGDPLDVVGDDVTAALDRRHVPAAHTWREAAALGEPPSFTAGWERVASTMSAMYSRIESSMFTPHIAEGISAWSVFPSATGTTCASMIPLRFFSICIVSAFVG